MRACAIYVAAGTGIKNTGKTAFTIFCDDSNGGYFHVLEPGASYWNGFNTWDPQY